MNEKSIDKIMQQANLKSRCKRDALRNDSIQCDAKFVAPHLEGIVGWCVFVTMAVMTILATIIHYFPPVPP